MVQSADSLPPSSSSIYLIAKFGFRLLLSGLSYLAGLILAFGHVHGPDFSVST
jgi:hypothetical protein